MSLVVYLIAIIITLPVLALFVLYWIFKGIFNNGKKAMHWSVDLTTIITIFSVDAVMYAIWGQHYIIPIILGFLFVSIAFSILYLLVREQLNVTKLIKGIWRFNFLVFMLAYICLILYGLVSGIAKQV